MTEKTAADARALEGPGTPFPPLLLFTLGFLIGLWIDNGVALALRPAQPDAMWAAAGAVLAMSGAALFAWGLWTFAQARTGIMLQHAATSVVTQGPYRWTRNPMYVGCVLLYVGASLVFNSLWPILLLPAVIVLLNDHIIAREEQYMRTMFGDAYEAYCRRVRRWV